MEESGRIAVKGQKGRMNWRQEGKGSEISRKENNEVLRYRARLAALLGKSPKEEDHNEWRGVSYAAGRNRG